MSQESQNQFFLRIATLLSICVVLDLFKPLLNYILIKYGINTSADSSSSCQIFHIGERKRIALVAHDNKKAELIEWVKRNREQLIKHELHATGTTGKLIESILAIQVTKYKSGPLGGDQQLGAKIAEQCIDILIFLADPLQAQPHDSDVRALTRLASVWNIPMACNLSTADFLLTSPYISSSYTRIVPSFEQYLTREIKNTSKD